MRSFCRAETPRGLCGKRLSTNRPRGRSVFIRALFSRDNGRVAYLYDALVQFDRPTSNFSLGLWIDDTGRRVERFTSLLKALDAFPGWVVPERPFRRPPDDPVLMLMRVPAAPDGEPAGPSWRAFWAHAFASTDIPDDPDRLLRNVRADGRIDAAWLAEAILAAELQSRGERLDQLAFGLRAFAAADDRMLPDVLVAVRAFPRYRMLMLTLERMGIANPAVYAAAARQAVRLSSLDANRGFVALGQFQSALAILARLVDTHVLDAATRRNDWPWRSAPCLSTPMARMPAESPAGFNTRSRRPSASASTISMPISSHRSPACDTGRRVPRANARVVGAEHVRARPHDGGGAAPDPRARKASSRLDQPGAGSGNSRGTSSRPGA